MIWWLVCVLRVISIGRWSECSAMIVFHVKCLCSEVGTSVMSGDVFCWLVLLGILVGVSVLSVMSEELLISSSICVPLWSVYGEYHSVECAFASEVIIGLCSVFMCVNRLVMSESSVFWEVFEVSLGGMYMLTMCMC